MLPNWLGVGFPRAGTTTIAYILQQHPDIYIPKAKEAHFFNEFLNWRGAGESIKDVDLARYETNYFSEWNGQRSIGEITPNYLLTRATSRWLLARIGETIEMDGKFLVCLRHPVRRAFSNHQFLAKSFWTDKFFAEDVLAGAPILADESLAGSLYLRHVKELLDTVGRSRVFFTVYETDVVDNLPLTMAHLFDFLGVDNSFSDFHPDTHLNRVSAPEVEFFDEAGFAKLSEAGAGEMPTTIKVPAGAIVMKTGWYPWDRVLRSPSRRSRRSFMRIRDIGQQRLDDELIDRLMTRFYRNEVERLQDLIDMDLSCWLSESVAI